MTDKTDCPLSNMELLRLAHAVAAVAHHGQVDKAGEPYIGHPRRVAAKVETAIEQATALLHDVVEDTTLDLDSLRYLGLPPQVIEAVDALTHRASETRAAYYERVKANSVALAVKLADIEDNTAPGRMSKLDFTTAERLRAKYAHARKVLTNNAHPDEVQSSHESTPDVPET